MSSVTDACPPVPSPLSPRFALSSMDMEQRDYDSRTALHVAAAEGRSPFSGFFTPHLHQSCLRSGFYIFLLSEKYCFVLKDMVRWCVFYWRLARSTQCPGTGRQTEQESKGWGWGCCLFRVIVFMFMPLEYVHDIMFMFFPGGEIHLWMKRCTSATMTW